MTSPCLVSLESAGESVLLNVRAPEQTKRIFSVPSTGWFGGPGVVDRLGIWLYVTDQGTAPGILPPGAAQGIFLFTKAAGVRKVSGFAGVPVGNLS